MDAQLEGLPASTGPGSNFSSRLLNLNSGCANQAGPTYSETDSNDLELCISYNQEDSDEVDKDKNCKSGSKRSLGSRDGSKGKQAKDGREGTEGSRVSKKGKGEFSTVQDTLSLINLVQQVRMARYQQRPRKRAAEILAEMNLDNELFSKGFAWITTSSHKASAFLGLSDELRRIWIKSLP